MDSVFGLLSWGAVLQPPLPRSRGYPTAFETSSKRKASLGLVAFVSFSRLVFIS